MLDACPTSATPCRWCALGGRERGKGRIKQERGERGEGGRVERGGARGVERGGGRGWEGGVRAREGERIEGASSVEGKNEFTQI